MKRKLLDNRRKVEAKRRKRRPYGILRTYNPKDVTVTIGGIEIKDWENFDFNMGGVVDYYSLDEKSGNRLGIISGNYIKPTTPQIIIDSKEAVEIIKGSDC